MAAKTKEREQAFDLFINTSLTLKEIAQMVKVSQNQIGKWAEADKWELSRTGKQNTSGQIIAGWYVQLKMINDEVTKQGGIPTTAQSDTMSKIADNIQKLSKRQNLSMYYMVLKEFLKELMISNVDASKILAPLMLDFIKQKAQTLANDI